MKGNDMAMTKAERKELEKAKVLIQYRRPIDGEIRYWRKGYHWPDQWNRCTIAEWEVFKKHLENIGIYPQLLEDDED